MKSSLFIGSGGRSWSLQHFQRGGGLWVGCGYGTSGVGYLGVGWGADFYARV